MRSKLPLIGGCVQHGQGTCCWVVVEGKVREGHDNNAGLLSSDLRSKVALALLVPSLFSMPCEDYFAVFPLVGGLCASGLWGAGALCTL